MDGDRAAPPRDDGALAVLALALALAACGGVAAPAPRAPETPLPAVVAAPAPVTPPTAPPPPPDPVGPPEGYVEMRATHVAPFPQGDAVVLTDEGETILLPIFVGGTEALSIQLRLAREPFQRPLTHDLVDSLLSELGGSIAKVQVDELRGTTFIGSVWVRHGGRVVRLDARPSDAIALAIGAGAPIYVARAVLATAGIPSPAIPAAPGPSPPPTTPIPPTPAPAPAPQRTF